MRSPSNVAPRRRMWTALLAISIVYGVLPLVRPAAAQPLRSSDRARDAGPPNQEEPAVQSTPEFWISSLLNGELTFKGRPVPEFVYVQPGRFLMGRTDEEKFQANKDSNGFQHDCTAPQVQAIVTTGFFISKFEVTRAEYIEFLRDTGFDERLRRTNRPLYEKLYSKPSDDPVSEVSWDDASAYCRWLSDQFKATVRLPTEVEWEYAARGFAGTRFPWPDKVRFLEVLPQMNGKGTARAGRVGTVPQDRSWCGAMDMGANLSEWCYDVFQEDRYQRLQEEQPLMYRPLDRPRLEAAPKEDVSMRVHRGGSFIDSRTECESAGRRPKRQGDRFDFVGFRPVLLVPTERVFPEK
jgi:formylglycine-generating enzyme required for sulfatase activity